MFNDLKYVEVGSIVRWSLYGMSVEDVRECWIGDFGGGLWFESWMIYVN